MSRFRTAAQRLLVVSILTAGASLTLAAEASAKELVNLVCTGSNHVTAKAGHKTLQDEEFPWKQNYTLQDDGTFIALTGAHGAIEKGKLTVTTRRYYLDFDRTDPEIKKNGGGLYIDRQTGALSAIGVKHDGNREMTFTSTGLCKVDTAEPKF